MGYIDAYYDTKIAQVIISLQDSDGEYKEITIPAEFFYYLPKKGGEYKSIFGEELERIDCKTSQELRQAQQKHEGQTHEANTPVVFKALEKLFHNQEVENNANVCFFDIEVDFDHEYGYSSPDAAFNPITAISFYDVFKNRLACLAVPPNTLDYNAAQSIASSVGNTILYDTEGEMLDAFLQLTDHCTVFSGWNSSGYDIPYMVHRIQKILGRGETTRLCLWNTFPRQTKGIFGGKEFVTYDLIGKTHLDYMDLYKNFTFETKQSYSLDNIAEEELGQKKVEYEGSLHDLYRNDFKTFLEYSLKDSQLLYDLDRNLRFIDLAFSIAYDNCVLPKTVLGTVKMMEQAVRLEAHNRDMIVPDKIINKENEKNKQSAGGWVIDISPGLHRWVGSVDIASLYPSIIRALNLSPETLIGQVNNDKTYDTIEKWIGDSKQKTFTQWWHNRFSTLEMEHVFDRDDSYYVQLDLCDGSSEKVLASDVYDMIFNSDTLCITANGTIMRTDIEGIIPGLLTRWFNERKVLKKNKSFMSNIVYGDRKISNDIHQYFKEHYDESRYNDKLSNVYFVKESDFESAQESPERFLKFCYQWHLSINDNAQVIPKDDASKHIWKEAESYWDKQQHVKKILLNSCYGGLLNQYFFMYDQRIGQSVTLSGRSVTKHMDCKTNEIITGEYSYVGDALVAGDTDSVYFTVDNTLDRELTEDEYVELYDSIADQVDQSFSEFMKRQFNVTQYSSEIIRCEREIVARSAYFVTKKRYAALVVDKEGERITAGNQEPNYKIMGLEIRRADTPKFIQNFLKATLKDILKEESKEFIQENVNKFKNYLFQIEPWMLGSPSQVNNLTFYMQKEEEYLNSRLKKRKITKPTIPGHVRASMNWNRLIDTLNDKNTQKITDGQRIITCKLKNNDYNIQSIAYPLDAEGELPEWFKTLPFDKNAMIEVVFVKKLTNLIRPLGWNLSSLFNNDREQLSHF